MIRLISSTLCTTVQKLGLKVKRRSLVTIAMRMTTMIKMMTMQSTTTMILPSVVIVIVV